MGDQHQYLAQPDQEQSIDSERQRQNEKLRDEHFEKEFFKFFKNMIERLGPEVLEDLNQKSKKFCDAIDQA